MVQHSLLCLLMVWDIAVHLNMEKKIIRSWSSQQIHLYSNQLNLLYEAIVLWLNFQKNKPLSVSIRTCTNNELLKIYGIKVHVYQPNNIHYQTAAFPNIPWKTECFKHHIRIWNIKCFIILSNEYLGLSIVFPSKLACAGATYLEKHLIWHQQLQKSTKLFHAILGME